MWLCESQPSIKLLGPAVTAVSRLWMVCSTKIGKVMHGVQLIPANKYAHLARANLK